MIVPADGHVSAQVHCSVRAQGGGDVGHQREANGLDPYRTLGSPLPTDDRHQLNGRAFCCVLRRDAARRVEHDLVDTITVEITLLVLDEQRFARIR